LSNSIINATYDGIIILEHNGILREVNGSAAALLGIDKSYVGKPYAHIMEENDIQENDAFHQLLLDAIKEKKIEKESVPYVQADGTRSYFNISVSKMECEDGSFRFYIVFKDITGEVREQNLRTDYTNMLLIILGFCALYNFVAVIWQSMGHAISQSLFSSLTVAAAFIGCVFLIKCTDLTKADLGLEIKGKGKALITDSIATVICVLILCIVKALILKVNPSYEFYTDGSFIQWNKYSLGVWAYYILSVIGQQFVARSFLHESFARMIPNDDKEIKTILLSSLIFGSIHFYLGLVYMLSATAMLCVFGFIYRKQRSVWALCIPHYVLGNMIGLLGFVAF